MPIPVPERVRDLLDLAIADEVRARDLYAAWKDRVEDGVLAQLLVKMAEDEDGHRAILEALRRLHSGLPPVRVPLTTSLPPWAARPVAVPPASVRDLLIAAVRDERHAHLRYAAMAEVAPSPKMHAACRTLANEEAVHQRNLEEQFERLFPNG